MLFLLPHSAVCRLGGTSSHPAGVTAITVTQTTEGVKCTELIILIYVTAENTSLVSINRLVQFGVKTWEYTMQSIIMMMM